MMDVKKTILYGVLIVVVYSLWMSWQKDYPVNVNTKVNQVAVVNDKNVDSGGFLPSVEAHDEVNLSKSGHNVVTQIKDEQNNKLVHVKTDVLDIDIDLEHGDIVEAKLLKYPQSLKDKNDPVVLLNNSVLNRYVANGNILKSSNGNLRQLVFNYTADQSEYVLSETSKELKVLLQGTDANGLKVNKIYTFNKGSYLINVNYDIDNVIGKPQTVYLNNQLLRENPAQDKTSMFHVGSYSGASVSNPQDKLYQKISFAKMNKGNFSSDVTGGWVAMQQHYFLSAWIPDSKLKNKQYTRVVGENYLVGTVSRPLTIKPHQNLKISSNLYIGPELTSQLKLISPGLDLTVDYGWLSVISMFIFLVMSYIYSFVGNWGVAIILVTVLIKLIFFKLSASSYKSMAKMRNLQPKLEQLKNRYTDDKPKLSKATMELYKKEKVNPLGSCLPIFVQIPVFIALYWVLLESVELRQAPFMLWVKDLSAADPLYILPLLMGASMFIQQKLNPPPQDPTQAKLMMFLPVVFTFLFLHFPAGLVLYWFVNNTLSILQQWYIMNSYDKAKKK